MTRNSFEKSGKDWLEKNKIAFGYETARVPYTLTKYYVPDFSIPPMGNRPGMHIEFKGYLRPQDIVKMKAVKRCNPELDIRFVFQSVNKKVRKGSNMTYADWCKKYGFIYAEKTIPKKWFK